MVIPYGERKDRHRGRSGTEDGTGEKNDGLEFGQKVQHRTLGDHPVLYNRTTNEKFYFISSFIIIHNGSTLSLITTPLSQTKPPHTLPRDIFRKNDTTVSVFFPVKFRTRPRRRRQGSPSLGQTLDICSCCTTPEHLTIDIRGQVGR